MFDKLTDFLISQVAGDPQTRDRGQVQLDRAIEKRFDPCVALWQQLWAFQEKVTQGKAAAADVQALLQQVNGFLANTGALVSPRCLIDLVAFRDELVALSTSPNFDLRITGSTTLLLPGKDKPGLLLRVRDEIGSNLPSASSALK